MFVLDVAKGGAAPVALAVETSITCKQISRMFDCDELAYDEMDA